MAYCAQPEETVALIREWGIPVVRGNCEESLGSGAQDCGCGFDEGTTCSLLSVDWYRFADERISEDDRVWMRTLPGFIRFTLNGKSVRVVHGGVEQVNRFIFPSTAVAIKQAELTLAGTDILIGGHSGILAGQVVGEKVWINVGAIGLPANDGTRDGWFVLLTPEDDRLRCRWERLCYRVESTITVMKAAGMVSGYADTLLTGLWPSMDVLPAAKRESRGQSIVMDELIS